MYLDQIELDYPANILKLSTDFVVIVYFLFYTEFSIFETLRKVYC